MSPAARGRKKNVSKVRAQGARRRSKIAADAAADAKAKGATGDARGKARAVKRTRDTTIVARAWAGVTTKAIAEEMQVTQRTVQRVLADFDAASSGLDARPMEVVEKLSRSYLRLYSDFTALAHEYEGKFPSASIGALNKARETLTDWVTLLASIGKLPTDLEVLAAEADLLRMGHMILEGVEQLERGEITAGQLAELARGIVLARGLPPGDSIEGRESEPKKRNRKRGGTPTAD